MTIHQKPAPLLTRRAATGGATSWNEATRTFHAVVATATPVLRRDWDGPYHEILDVAGVELAGSVPFLNAHRTGQIGDVIGKVERVERSGDKLEAIIRLSGRDDLAGLARDIGDGVVDAVSIGYVVHDWLDETAEDGTRTKTATRWTLVETSAVPIPADPNARIRSKENMTTNTDPATPEEITSPAVRAPRGTRAATETEVRALAHVAKLDDDFVREQIDAGATMAQVRAAAIDALAIAQSRQPATRSHVADPGVGGSLDDPQFRVRAMSDAIVARSGLPGFEPSAAARQFAGLSLPEMARESLRLASVDVRGLGASQVVQRALGGLHSTSDFANALTSAAFAILRKGYESAPSGLKPLARRLDVTDFRARTIVGVSGIDALEKVNEHGEFRRGTVKDSGENIRIETYGKIFGVSRQVIINDDLGVIADTPRRLGAAAAAFEAEQLAALLTSNPVMSDGKTVFHADHGNVADAGAALAEAALSAARLAMRKQRDENGQLLGLAPRHLVVGAELETDAERLMATITPATVDDAQPIKLAIAVEPRIAGKSWYIAAAPEHADGMAFAYLSGEPGPQLEQRAGFDVDGIEFKVRLDYGCAFADFRSWYKNAGAS